MNTFGFIIRGATHLPRSLVVHPVAFAACCGCDERAEPAAESYLSAFEFGRDFRAHLAATGSVRGYDGPTWASYLPFDIDRDGDFDAALADAKRLAAHLGDRYGVDGDLLAFVSGGKGFHLGLPTGLFRPDPSPLFHRRCRAFAERVAGEAGVSIDSGVYDRVRAWRSPNSRHPKTGLHKRRIDADDLLRLSAEGAARSALQPAPFDPPGQPSPHETALADWRSAVEAVDESDAAQPPRGDVPLKLNRRTLEFIREGATAGDRHRLLYSAARNLAEFDCPAELAHALLGPAALDCGLPPRDVARQVDCGLADGRKGVA